MNAIKIIIFCAVSSTYCCSKPKRCHEVIIKPEAENVGPKIRPITLDPRSKKFKIAVRRRMMKNKQRLGPRFYFWEKYGMRSMHKTAIFNTLVDFWIFLLKKVFLLMNFSYFWNKLSSQYFTFIFRPQNTKLCKTLSLQWVPEIKFANSLFNIEWVFHDTVDLILIRKYYFDWNTNLKNYACIKSHLRAYNLL